MNNIAKRLSQLEHTMAKTQVVTVSFIGKRESSTNMDLLQAVQLLLERKVHQISLKMTPEESQETLSETALQIEAYICEWRKEV